MNTSKSLAFGACLTLASFGVTAQVVVEGTVETDGTNSYVTSDGSVLKTGLSECLQTGTFSEDAIINKCEGIEDVVEAEPPAPVVQEVAAAPVGKLDIREFNEQTLFDTNSAELSPAGEAAITRLFGALAEYQDITAISVVGYTDNRGEEAYNLALSEKRAQTIASVIAAQYPTVNIAVQGMGENDPATSNDTAEGRQLNRRVEVEVTASRMVYN